MERIKEIWPKWEVLEVIGQGGFGTVYKAKRENFNETSYCAIKVVRIPSNKSEVDEMTTSGMSKDHIKGYYYESVKQYIKEIKLMETMKSASNIVSIEDYEVVENVDSLGWTIYIRMELLTNLQKYMLEHSMSNHFVANMAIDILTALEFCHNANIVHRDIKPGNIFVSKFDQFKLGDFGVSKEVERMSATMSQKGTKSYMAPEMVRMEHYDHTVDLYALGLTMYELLNNGRMPFLPEYPQPYYPTDREEAMLKRLSGEAFPLIKGLNALSLIINKACHYDPKQRYQSASEMKEVLVEYVNELKKADQQFEEKVIDSRELSQDESTQGIFNDFMFDNETTILQQDNNKGTLLLSTMYGDIYDQDGNITFISNDSTFMSIGAVCSTEYGDIKQIAHNVRILEEKVVEKEEKKLFKEPIILKGILQEVSKGKEEYVTRFGTISFTKSSMTFIPSIYPLIQEGDCYETPYGIIEGKRLDHVVSTITPVFTPAGKYENLYHSEVKTLKGFFKGFSKSSIAKEVYKTPYGNLYVTEREIEYELTYDNDLKEGQRFETPYGAFVGTDLILTHKYNMHLKEFELADYVKGVYTLPKNNKEYLHDKSVARDEQFISYQKALKQASNKQTIYHEYYIPYKNAKFSAKQITDAIFNLAMTSKILTPENKLNEAKKDMEAKINSVLQSKDFLTKKQPLEFPHLFVSDQGFVDYKIIIDPTIQEPNNELRLWTKGIWEIRSKQNVEISKPKEPLTIKCQHCGQLAYKRFTHGYHCNSEKCYKITLTKQDNIDKQREAAYRKTLGDKSAQEKVNANLELLKLDPKCGQVAVKLASYYENTQDSYNYKKYLDEALRLEPNDALIQIYYFLYHLNRKEYKETLTYSTRAVALADKGYSSGLTAHSPYLNHAIALERNNRSQESFQYTKKAYQKGMKIEELLEYVSGWKLGLKYVESEMTPILNKYKKQLTSKVTTPYPNKVIGVENPVFIYGVGKGNINEYTIALDYQRLVIKSEGELWYFCHFHIDRSSFSVDQNDLILKVTQGKTYRIKVENANVIANMLNEIKMRLG